MNDQPDPRVDGDLRAPLRNPATDNAPGGRVPPAEMDETTGLPAVRTWRGVYTIVLGFFVLWVGLLTWLTFAYS